MDAFGFVADWTLVKGLENTLGAMQQLLFCLTRQIMIGLWSLDQEGSCSPTMAACETGECETWATG